MFRNPALAHTYRLIAEGGGRAFYEGEIADRIEAYFKRIGGWMTKADLAAHHTEWVEPRSINYRGDRRLGPAAQQPGPGHPADPQHHGAVRHQGAWASSRPPALHHEVEAKRLAFEDRAKFYADPDFYKQPDRLAALQGLRHASAPS